MHSNYRTVNQYRPCITLATAVSTTQANSTNAVFRRQRNYIKHFVCLHSIRSPIGIVNNKSRSIHNLTGNTDQSFYQNLSVYRAQNQSQPNLGDRYVYHSSDRTNVRNHTEILTKSIFITQVPNSPTIDNNFINKLYNDTI